MPHTQVDWAKLGAELYNYWFVGASVVAFAAWVFRSPIFRQITRLTSALRAAHSQSLQIASLEDELAESKSQADDWRARFDEMEARYDALIAEANRARDDMRAFRKRMTTAEQLVRTLTKDRDALIDAYRGVVGQLFEAGQTPAYPAPALQSMVDVPGSDIHVTAEVYREKTRTEEPL